MGSRPQRRATERIFEPPCRRTNAGWAIPRPQSADWGYLNYLRREGKGGAGQHHCASVPTRRVPSSINCDSKSMASIIDAPAMLVNSSQSPIWREIPWSSTRVGTGGLSVPNGWRGVLCSSASPCTRGTVRQGRRATRGADQFLTLTALSLTSVEGTSMPKTILRESRWAVSNVGNLGTYLRLSGSRLVGAGWGSP